MISNVEDWRTKTTRFPIRRTECSDIYSWYFLLPWQSEQVHQARSRSREHRIVCCSTACSRSLCSEHQTQTRAPGTCCTRHSCNNWNINWLTQKSIRTHFTFCEITRGSRIFFQHQKPFHGIWEMRKVRCFPWSFSLVSSHLMQARESSSEVTIFIWLVGRMATVEFSSVQELNISVLKSWKCSAFTFNIYFEIIPRNPAVPNFLE